MLGLLCVVNELVLGHDSFGYLGVEEIHARGDSDDALGVVEDGVEVAEEGLPKNETLVVGESKGDEAFVGVADVDDEGLRRHLKVVAVVDEERDRVVLGEVAAANEYIVEAVVLNPMEELREDHGPQRLGQLDVGAESVKVGVGLIEEEGVLGPVFEARQVRHPEGIDLQLPKLLVGSLQESEGDPWDRVLEVESSQLECGASLGVEVDGEDLSSNLV
uniref:Uncharacterized protein n=1 Tax=Strombidium rassoulzadegani TaxID=1082188 RepID=A0A7S3FV92_9SPIT|mmetsp:Transcript_4168/g.7064  ORF Transcript_4168/g.7064 Transcript_4168/m.7064 type:complete len:218 (+) Transcript_4168:518-1171(+)